MRRVIPHIFPVMSMVKMFRTDKIVRGIWLEYIRTWDSSGLVFVIYYLRISVARGITRFVRFVRLGSLHCDEKWKRFIWGIPAIDDDTSVSMPVILPSWRVSDRIPPMVGTTADYIRQVPGQVRVHMEYRPMIMMENRCQGKAGCPVIYAPFCLGRGGSQSRGGCNGVCQLM
jgi:hypothetical protein